MVVYLGWTVNPRHLAVVRARGWGRLVCERWGAIGPGDLWALDNGCYAAWKNQEPWNSSRFLKRVEWALTQPTPQFAVLPDRPADPGSLEFSLTWRARLPDELPWYLAIQDGMTEEQVVGLSYYYRGLFMGGSDAFKATAPSWRRLAHALNMPFHYARAGTPKKLGIAFHTGADSCDSALPLWTYPRFYAYERRYRELHEQEELPLFEAEV